MTRIINLRQARKKRARTDKRQQGDLNAARHGEAKPLRDARQAEADRAARILDAHRTAQDPDAPKSDAPKSHD